MSADNIKDDLKVSLFERRLWQDANILVVRGSLARVLEGMRDYEARHEIEPIGEDRIGEVSRLMGAAGLAAVSLAERESWGWTLTTAGAPHGFFCGVEPEGMICARVREAPTDRASVYLQRQKGTAPLVESHYEPVGNDPAVAIQRYYEQVEQTRTRIAVSDDLDCVLFQAMPGGDFSQVSSLSEDDLFALATRLSGDERLTRLDEVVLFYECRCDDEMILEMLTSLPHRQREELWGDLEQLEAECPRCGRRYMVKKGPRR